jgi:hypothetical protein
VTLAPGKPSVASPGDGDNPVPGPGLDLLVDLAEAGRLSKQGYYEALTLAFRTGREDAVTRIEQAMSKHLAAYRNLAHLRQSAAFFGAAHVRVLHDEPGAFRIIDCDSRVSSDVLFVTFSIVSGHVDHLPFAQSFLAENKFRHIHVAHWKKTSYQRLSLDEFAHHLTPIADGYRSVFTYGVSLGGYAAIYYAGPIEAHPIAASPRLPLHPLNQGFRGLLWQPGSHWDETKFRHQRLSQLRLTPHAPVVLFDPADPIDARYVEEELVPAFRNLQCIHVEGAGHSALKKLATGSNLKRSILSIVEQRLGLSLRK